MNIQITKTIEGGSVKSVASKSQAHRFLICAALSNSETFIECESRSDDIDATARCLEELGATVKYSQSGFHVTPISKSAVKEREKVILDCGESGSTLRFLLPVCGALGCEVSFIMRGRLSSRPISPLCDEMSSHGCIVSYINDSQLFCKGQMTGGTYTLSGDISSQYTSGLLFALPFLPAESLVRVTGVLESRPYVDMTIDALRLFSISIFEDEKQSFRVPGGQTGASCGKVQVEGDWSNAAFWLSAGAVGKNGITCTGLNPNSKQGDRAIIDLLSRFGAKIIIDDDKVTVNPGKLRAIDIDAKNIPDLVPVLAAVAAVAEGKTVIRNAARLRVKESDRLRTAASSLSSLGADITETEDGLIINGKKKLKGGETESFSDHRIAMTAAVISSVCEGPVLIKNAEAVNKSYPKFFEDFLALDGICEAL